MDSLVVCQCRHSIVAHETGRCLTPGCECMRGSLAVLNDAIDRTKPDASHILTS